MVACAMLINSDIRVCYGPMGLRASTAFIGLLGDDVNVLGTCSTSSHDTDGQEGFDATSSTTVSTQIPVLAFEDSFWYHTDLPLLYFNSLSVCSGFLSLSLQRVRTSSRTFSHSHRRCSVKADPKIGKPGLGITGLSLILYLPLYCPYWMTCGMLLA